jgi:hypothetical protein
MSVYIVSMTSGPAVRIVSSLVENPLDRAVGAGKAAVDRMLLPESLPHLRRSRGELITEDEEEEKEGWAGTAVCVSEAERGRGARDKEKRALCASVLWITSEHCVHLCCGSRANIVCICPDLQVYFRDRLRVNLLQSSLLIC